MALHIVTLIGLLSLTFCLNPAAAQIYSNPITGTDPGLSNPYTTGQSVATGITGYGIGYGSGLTGVSANDMVGLTGAFNSASQFAALNENKYVSLRFSTADANCYSINLNSAVVTINYQTAGTGPKKWALYSNINGFTNGSEHTSGSLGTNATGTITYTFPATGFNNITSSIEFRLALHDAAGSASALTFKFAVHSFSITGAVNDNTPAQPGTPTSNSPQCSPGSVTLTRAGSPPGGVTWYWQTSAGGTSTASSGATYTAATSGTYYLRAKLNSADCWSTAASLAVVVSPTPSASAGPDAIVCSGAHTLAATAPQAGQTGAWAVTAMPTGASAPTFSPDNTSPTASVTFAKAGVYTLRWRISAPGCTSSDDFVTIRVLSSTFTAGIWTGLANDQNWANCRNWANGVVPTSGAGVAVLLPDTVPAYLGGGSVTTLPQNIPSISIAKLTIASGLAGGATYVGLVEVADTLRLTNGILHGTGGGAILYVSGTNSTIVTQANTPVTHINTASFVDGYLRRKTELAKEYPYPVGDASSYKLLYYNQKFAAAGKHTTLKYNTAIPFEGSLASGFLPYANHSANFEYYLPSASWEIVSNSAATDYDIEVFPGMASLTFCPSGMCTSYTLTKNSGGTWSNGTSQPVFYTK